MILVVCSVVDDAAVKLAEEIRSFTAASVLTCRDLAMSKCALRCPDVVASEINLHGHKVMGREIRGAVNLLPAVFPDELYFYPDSEREYQAAEFHALLTFFLAALPCAVVNRPTATSLVGPYSGRSAWLQVASKLRIPIAEVRLSSEEWAKSLAMRPPGSSMDVVCLHGAVLSGSGPSAEYASRLAAAARVEYLRASFVRTGDVGVALFSVSTVPDLRDAATRDGLIRLCHGWAGAQ
jgi:hypothetical protein